MFVYVSELVVTSSVIAFCPKFITLSAFESILNFFSHTVIKASLAAHPGCYYTLFDV